MAYQVRRTLAELEQECNLLEILDDVKNYGTENRVYKNDYVDALRRYFLQKKYNNQPPESMQMLVDHVESPMLAQRYQVLKDKEQKEIWESDDWYLEEKCDGVRMVITYLQDEGFNFFSRNISVEDYLPNSYKDNIWLGDDIDYTKITDDFIVDSEIVSLNPHICTVMEDTGVTTETQLQAVQALLSTDPEKTIPIQKEGLPLQFITFDCIYWNGEWLFDKTLLERREFLNKAIKQLKDAGVNVRLPMSNRSKKKAFYKDIIMDGGEGVISKRVTAKYYPTSSRKRDVWVKIKRDLSNLEDEGLFETIDAWVSGYKRGTKGKKWENYVGALEFSVNLEDLDASIFGDEVVEPEIHQIAVVSSLTDDLREELTDYDEEGNPILKKEWYGKVAELDGMNISARSKSLKHARMIQWRPDKSPNECRIDKGWLESMIL